MSNKSTATMSEKPKAKESLSLMSPFAGEWFTIFSSSFTINILALAFPLLMLQLYDRILPYESVDTLGLVAITVLLAIFVETLLRIARSYSTAWTAARFEYRAMMALTERALAEPLHQFERKGTGAVMSRFKAIGTLRYHYSGQTFQQLMDLPFTFLYVLIAAVMSPWIGLLLLAGYAVFIVIIWHHGKSFPALVKEQKEADLRRGNFLNETLRNIHTLKSMTMEALMLRRHERLQEACARLMSRVTYALDMSSGLGNIFSPLMTVLTVALGAWLVINGDMTNGELAACVLLGMRSLAPLQRLGGIWSKHQQDKILRADLARELAQPQLPVEPPHAVSLDTQVVPGEIRGVSIGLQNVTYRFPCAEKPLFENLSLNIEPNECLLIEGQSGSGRSTLLQLLAGVVEPLDGQILIDHRDIKFLSSTELGHSLAYLSQQTQMFEGSLLDNISSFDDDRIDLALDTAKRLGLGEFVSRMPRGWDSTVGDMATDSMPPGYRQRLAIVRALSGHPRVILFDDATSTMDSEGDTLFLRYLQSMVGRVTIVMISQRPSYKRLATKTIYLRNGRFSESGQTEPQDEPIAEVSPALDSLPSANTQSQTTLPQLGDALPSTTVKPLPNALESEFDPLRWDRAREMVDAQFKVRTDFAGCLTVLLKQINARVSTREIAESLPYFEEALDLSGFQNAMAELGYKPKEVRCRLGALEVRSLPCLFVPDHDLAFIVLGRTGHQVRVANDPDQEARLVSDLNIEGRAFFYEQVDRSTVENGSWAMRALKRFAPLIGQATLSALVTGLVLMAGPLFMMVVYSTVIPTGAEDTLFYLSVGAVLALLSSFAFMRHRAHILAYIAGRIEYLFGASILQQVFRMSPSFTERSSVGAQTSRIQSFEAIRDMFIGPLASTFLESPATIVLLVALSIINPIALLVFGIMVLIYAVLYWTFSGRTQALVTELSQAVTERDEFLVELIVKMRAVRESHAQRLWLERFREVSATAAMASFKSERLSSLLVSSSYFLMMLAALGIVVATVPAVWSHSVTSGALIASLMLMWRVLTPVQTVFTNMTRMRRVGMAVKQIDSLMRIQPERIETSQPVSSRKLAGEIEFARVSFRYSIKVDPALIGVEFRIQPGQIVAMTGPNGGGKSTLLKLILGMYQPQAGAILLDNIDIRQIDPLVLRRYIGYAPQDIQLFRATIAQNLRLARPDATDGDLYECLEMAGALEQVLALPQGLQYRVGDNTNELAASLKQKLSLARAYLTRAPIMLFDEPGNGLDELGDRKFIETIKSMRGNTTVVFISHRPSHIKLADTLMIFDKGYLRASGAPDALLRQPVAS
ncbi:peptidase domain-containing ABC transporter [Zwartia vadi]|uniref:peptidase domain-containing ABC transporter n=1 Tax=Zwartia vadi TaxID=3058168 RepID=UPI0025B58D21|nr:ATP-binding cassette domain-containing protein [Zwartia vadi]MDN3988440.1 ATP-binding cassette domain-containing protein [Zwartia vadi]